MPSTTVVHACPHRDSKHLQKNRRNGPSVDCKRTFTLLPKGPRYGERFKAQVVAYQDRMRGRVREKAGRKAAPSAAILDSQSVKTTKKGGLSGAMTLASV